MARSPEGRRLRKDARTGIWFVRWRDANGTRHHRSTGERNRREAEAAAERIVREATRAGRVARGSVALDPDLVAAWIADYGASHAPGTADACESWAGVHWLPRWATVQAIDERALAEYVRDRLRVVTASTVRKEASGLRAFLGWCVERGHLAEAPEVPSVPKRATGTPFEGGKRTPRRVDLTPPKVEAILDAMPMGVERGAATLIWETTLRLATVAKLERPRHYRPGAPELTVTADIDKARMARALPLSLRARAILDAHATADGPIFPGLSIRRPLAAAALLAGLPPDDARRVSSHDLRHAAITDIVSRPGASLAGAGYLAGHRHASTTALYVHPGREAADAALAARIGTPDGTRTEGTKKRTRRPAKKSTRK